MHSWKQSRNLKALYARTRDMHHERMRFFILRLKNLNYDDSKRFNQEAWDLCPPSPIQNRFFEIISCESRKQQKRTGERL